MHDEATVHLVDDDEAVRRSLSYSIASAGFGTRVYGSAEELLRGATRLAPGVIVTDVRMPGIDGVELVRRLKEGGTPHPVIVISGHADIPLAVEAMKAGAADFLEKPFRPSQLVEAIRKVLEKAEKTAAAGPDAAQYRKMLSTLSPRQRDVLNGIVQGKLNKTIAHELGISVRTVEGYRAEIMSKVQARSVSELVRIAVLAAL